MNSLGMKQKQDVLEYKTIEYKNGFYQGYLKNSQRHGLGFYFWDSGHIYIGFWLNDVINGNGVLYFPKGGYFFGKFIDGKANGYCQLVYQDGSSQQGIWKQGNLQGKCLSLKNNEWKYEEYMQNTVKISSVNPQSKQIEMSLLSFILEKLFSINHETEIDSSSNAFRFIHPIFTYITIEVNFNENTIFILANTQNHNTENGFGVLHHHEKPLIRGYFIDGKLNGIGCVLQEGSDLYSSKINSGQFVDLNLSILDGIFIDGSFQYGVQYNQIKDHSQLCQVTNGQLFQISSSQGFNEDFLYQSPKKQSQNITQSNVLTSTSPSKQKSSSPLKKSNISNLSSNLEGNSLFKLTSSKELQKSIQVSQVNNSNTTSSVEKKITLQSIQNRRRVFGDLKQALEKFEVQQDNQLLMDYVQGQELGTAQTNLLNNQSWKDDIIKQNKLS